uniref:Uncharacterized protein n=1 Tax=Panagrolaimus sp. ES5 TaxID=591445 RepID=A0AC34GEW1_9BILA
MAASVNLFLVRVENVELDNKLKFFGSEARVKRQAELKKNRKEEEAKAAREANAAVVSERFLRRAVPIPAQTSSTTSAQQTSSTTSAQQSSSSTSAPTAPKPRPRSQTSKKQQKPKKIPKSKAIVEDSDDSDDSQRLGLSTSAPDSQRPGASDSQRPGPSTSDPFILTGKRKQPALFDPKNFTNGLGAPPPKKDGKK